MRACGALQGLDAASRLGAVMLSAGLWFCHLDTLDIGLEGGALGDAETMPSLPLSQNPFQQPCSGGVGRYRY